MFASSVDVVDYLMQSLGPAKDPVADEEFQKDISEDLELGFATPLMNCEELDILFGTINGSRARGLKFIKHIMASMERLVVARRHGKMCCGGAVKNPHCGHRWCTAVCEYSPMNFPELQRDVEK